MPKVKILPYKPGSASARELVRALAPNAIMKKQRTPMIGRSKLLLNWGNSSPQFNTTGCRILNKPYAVNVASDKLLALNAMKDAGINVPEFSTDINDAKRWIGEGKIVFCRTLLRANSGRGIVIAKEVAELIRAPLYVKYIRKEKEYRLHVFNGRVIDQVEKRRRAGFQEANNYNRYVRSYEQGWIMAREGCYITDETKSQAIKAVQALGLDFAAVDIVMTREGKPMVLEANTAPGIQGTTLENYRKAVIQWMQNLR
jgi:glutathione synthase/RimK-type ligase-like ATP-grasp enzyme